MDWESNETHILLNPRSPDPAPILPCEGTFAAHVWLATSGSTQLKYVALSKHAILSSAAAVNRFFNIASTDRWLCPLPHFHVGGLGILARAHLSHSPVIPLDKWDPYSFHTLVSEATLTSLVPTQLYDLVTHKLRPPPSLRAVIVGGGALNPLLESEARALGWPVFPSYGLTECSSQVATYQNGELSLLDHVQVEVRETIAIKSPALLTVYFIDNEIVDPKVEGWFRTQDCGLLENGKLKILGRKDDFIKIGGESVLLSRLHAILEQSKLELELPFDAALFAMPDERLGYVIHLAATAECETLCSLYNQSVMPFERIRKVHVLPKLPRSPLNKLLLHELIKALEA